jgi:hypothetical protein
MNNVLVSHCFTDIKQAMFVEVRSQIEGAEMDSEHRHHKQGAAVISKLLENGSMSLKEFRALTGLEIGRKLLGTNVFALHFSSTRVTFQSTVVKRYCEENINEFHCEHS